MHKKRFKDMGKLIHILFLCVWKVQEFHNPWRDLFCSTQLKHGIQDFSCLNINKFNRSKIQKMKKFSPSKTADF